MSSKKQCRQLIEFKTPFVFDGRKVRYNDNAANKMGVDEKLRVGQTHPLTYKPKRGILTAATSDCNEIDCNSEDIAILASSDNTSVSDSRNILVAASTNVSVGSSQNCVVLGFSKEPGTGPLNLEPNTTLTQKLIGLGHVVAGSLDPALHEHLDVPFTLPGGEEIVIGVDPKLASAQDANIQGKLYASELVLTDALFAQTASISNNLDARNVNVTETVTADIVDARLGKFQEVQAELGLIKKVVSELIETVDLNASGTVKAVHLVADQDVVAGESVSAPQINSSELISGKDATLSGDLSVHNVNASGLITADSLKVLHDAEVDGDVKTQNVRALFDVSGNTGNFAEAVSAGSGNFMVSKIDEVLTAKHIEAETINAQNATVENVTITGSVQGHISVTGDVQVDNLTAVHNVTAGDTIKGAVGEFQSLNVEQLSGSSANFTADVQVDGVLHAGAVEVDQLVNSPAIKTDLLEAKVAKITDLDVGETILAKTGRVNTLEAALAKMTDIQTSTVVADNEIQAKYGNFTDALASQSVESALAKFESATVKDVTVTGSATLIDVNVTNLNATNDVTAGNKVSAPLVAAQTATADYANSRTAEVFELFTAGSLKAGPSDLESVSVSTTTTTEDLIVNNLAKIARAEVEAAVIQQLEVDTEVAKSITTDVLFVNKLATAQAYTKFNAAQVISGGNSLLEYNGDSVNGTVPTILGLAPLTGPLTVALVSSGGLGGAPFLPGTTVVIKDATQQFQPNTCHNVLVKSVGGKIEHRDKKGRLCLSENGVYLLSTTGGSVTLTNVKGSLEDQDVWSIVAEVCGNRRSRPPRPSKPCQSGCGSDDCDCSGSDSDCSSSDSECDD